MNIEKNDIKREAGFKIETIEPISFRSKRPSRGLRRLLVIKWFASAILGMLLILLFALAGFVFTARQLVITVSPVPDRMNVSGGIFAPRIGGYYLVRPGEYRLTAFKACF